MRQRLLITFIFLAIIGLAGLFVWAAFPKLVTEDVPTDDNAELQAVELQETEAGPAGPTPIKLAPAAVTFANGARATFQLAEPFRLAVAAEGLGKARFMAFSPDGRMFVADMVNMNLSGEGKIYILENFDEKTKRFQIKRTYLSGLRGPNSVAFYTDENSRAWIYIALTANLIRYPYRAGDIRPSGKPKIITAFPNRQVSGESSVVWHITRTVKFHDNRLYVSVGSGCNACEQPKGEMRAMIYSMNPDGGDKRVYAAGLRNAVGFTWADGELYATVNGADHLGPQAPNDTMYRLTPGTHYGWPYCYESAGRIYPDTSKKWKQSFSCREVPLSFAAFEPHAAPLGLEYFDMDTHPVLKNAFLAALHGSFEPAIRGGYHIVRVSKDGEQEVFMDGFLREDREQSNRFIDTVEAHTDLPTGTGERIGRPVDILRKDADSFFFTDDHNGRMYYVYAE